MTKDALELQAEQTDLGGANQNGKKEGGASGKHQVDLVFILGPFNDAASPHLCCLLNEM